MSHNQRDAEHRLGQEIEDAVEDSFGVGGNEIRSLGDTPGDGVDQPDEECQDTAEHVGAVNVRAEELGALATYAGEVPEDVEHGGGAEGPPAPLPAAGSKSSNEAGDDHGPVHEDGPDDGGPGYTSCEQEIEQQLTALSDRD